MPAKALKAAEKQTILKKLVTEMKRRYGGSVPRQSRSTFETLLFAACLEDSRHDQAEAAYAQLLDRFFDFNEIRVSSINEIEAALGDLQNAGWKAMRIRESLQQIFEKHYAFDLEFLRRKTQDVALKELSQIPYQTPFIRTYTAQQSLGVHVLPIDQSTLHLLAWLGLVDAEAGEDAAAEELKSAVKKTDAPLICHLLHSVATDPELAAHFAKPPQFKEPPDPFAAPARLVDLFKNPKKRKAKAPARKAVSRKKPEKRTSSRTTAASAKKAVKKVTKKRPLAKKTTRKGSR